MKNFIRNIFNTKTQKSLAVASIAIGAASVLSGVFLAAAGEPTAVIGLTAGSGAMLFGMANWRKLSGPGSPH